jgi:hypothetical protein
VPEVNNKNIVNSSRQEIHQQDSEHFDDREDSAQIIHKDDTHQIKDLSDKLDAHCRQNMARDKTLDERDTKTERKLDRLLPLIDSLPLLSTKIDSLMWLNDEETKPIVRQIVIDSRGRTWLSIQIADCIKIVGAIALVLGAIWTAIQISRH